MIAVVTGLIAAYPVGGMAFHYAQYLLGLKALGWDVVYLEDTGRWFYDPEHATFSDDASANVRYLDRVLRRFGLDEAWCLRDVSGRLHGTAADELASIVRRADVFINVSGACWLRPEYRAIPRLIYVDTDPGYTHIKLARGGSDPADPHLQSQVELIRQHDVHATFGENVGGEGCSIPSDGLRWIRTRQPIVLELWPCTPYRGPVRFTSVLSWEPYVRPVAWGNRSFWGKRKELERFLDLPSLSAGPMELALAGDAPERELREHGWSVRPAMSVSCSPDAYRDYIASSGAEFSVAKDLYVQTRSGWFSERTACYLASGRPAVVQDTGFGRFLPTGQGLHAFDDPEDAAAAMRTVVERHQAECLAARRIAEEHFDARRVLTDLLVASGVLDG